MNNKKYSELTYKKIADVVQYYSDHIFQKIGTVRSPLAYETTEHLRTPPADELYRPITPGYKWGGEWGNIWLRSDITVPEEAAGHTLCLHPDLGAAEILCFCNGAPSGIVNSKSNFIGGMHCVMYLTHNARPGDRYRADLECYAGHWSPGVEVYSEYGHPNADPSSFSHTFRSLDVCIVNEDFKKCVFDLQAVLQFLKLPDNNFLHMRAHDAIMAAYPYVILDPLSADYEELLESARNISRELAPALEKGVPDRSRGLVGIVGH